MNWKNKLLKTAVMIVSSARVIGKGVSGIRNEIHGFADEYLLKIKALFSIGVALLVFVLFASLSLAFIINYFSGIPYLGFSVLSIIYLIVFLLILWKYRNKIEK